jgi:hypothetical protein
MTSDSMGDRLRAALAEVRPELVPLVAPMDSGCGWGIADYPGNLDGPEGERVCAAWLRACEVAELPNACWACRSVLTCDDLVQECIEGRCTQPGGRVPIPHELLLPS